MGDESRYRLIRELQRGGTAVVFEAAMLGAGGFERRVAIKQLKPELLADASAVAGFTDEARIVSQLHHAGIVSVLDFGFIDQLPFQTLELVEGIDLAELLRAKPPLSEGVAAYLVAEVAQTLAYVHNATDRQGRPLAIVHRDLSPENILVSFSGEVKLADFGVAFARDRIEATAIGVRKGKLDYMAPEQLRGEPVDGRADLHALGCVLHELLTGKSAMVRSAEALARSACVIDPRVPEDLARIIRKAVASDPGKRHQTAALMASECRRVAADRLGADGRAALIAHLEAIRSSRSKPKLDHLLDVELILSAGPAEEPTELTRLVTRTVALGTTVDRTLVRSGSVDKAPGPQRALLAVILAAAIIGVWLGTRSSGTPSAVSAPVLIATPASATHSTTIASDQIAPEPEPKEPKPEVAPPAPEPISAEPRPPKLRARAAAPRAPRAPPPAPEPVVRAPLDRDALARKMEHIRAELRQLKNVPSSEIDALDEAWLTQMTELRPGLTAAECVPLALKIDQLEKRVRRSRRVDSPPVP